MNEQLTPGRIAAFLGLAVLGFVVGTAGVLIQAAWLPLGLFLALLATGAMFYGGLRATGSQLAIAASGVGWLVSIVLLASGRPEGDGAFAGELGEAFFMLGGLALAVICATKSRIPDSTS
ncbi:DUF6113 family protein [Streptomyces sp. NPDC048604]|uniref:DUF6113 family protein n=1 Tax=Streptomyces sp. NPDC048604 TaxID=3365578 RepID=UPI003712AA6D